MTETGIFNAIIKKWDIIEDYDSSCIVIKLQFHSSIGDIDFSFNICYLQKIFRILDITSISQMKNQPCIIFVKDGLFKDMGSFLFYHYKNFELEENSWLFCSDIKNYYNELDSII